MPTHVCQRTHPSVRTARDRRTLRQITTCRAAVDGSLTPAAAAAAAPAGQSAVQLRGLVVVVVGRIWFVSSPAASACVF